MKHTLILVLLISLTIGLSACDRPALLTAAAKGQMSQVRTLLDSGTDINLRDTQDWTPLMAAAFNGRIETVKYLLEKGADVNLKNDDDLTALKLAKGRRHTAIVVLLKQAVAKGNNLTEQQQNKVIYRGNASTQIFHEPGCKHYDSKLCIAEFDSREEAIKAGFKPCKICKP